MIVECREEEDGVIENREEKLLVVESMDEQEVVQVLRSDSVAKEHDYNHRSTRMRRAQLFGTRDNSNSKTNMNTGRLSPAMQRAMKLSICTNILPDDDSSDDWNCDDADAERDNICNVGSKRDNLLCGSLLQVTPSHSAFASFDSFEGEESNMNNEECDGDADTDDGQGIGEGPRMPSYGVADMFQ